MCTNHMGNFAKLQILIQWAQRETGESDMPLSDTMLLVREPHFSVREV